MYVQGQLIIFYDYDTLSLKKCSKWLRNLPYVWVKILKLNIVKHVYKVKIYLRKLKWCK